MVIGLLVHPLLGPLTETLLGAAANGKRCGVKTETRTAKSHHVGARPHSNSDSSPFPNRNGDLQASMMKPLKTGKTNT